MSSAKKRQIGIFLFFFALLSSFAFWKMMRERIKNDKRTLDSFSLYIHTIYICVRTLNIHCISIDLCVARARTSYTSASICRFFNCLIYCFRYPIWLPEHVNQTHTRSQLHSNRMGMVKSQQTKHLQLFVVIVFLSVLNYFLDFCSTLFREVKNFDLRTSPPFLRNCSLHFVCVSLCNRLHQAWESSDSIITNGQRGKMLHFECKSLFGSWCLLV